MDTWSHRYCPHLPQHFLRIQFTYTINELNVKHSVFCYSESNLSHVKGVNKSCPMFVAFCLRLSIRRLKVRIFAYSISWSDTDFLKVSLGRALGDVGVNANYLSHPSNSVISSGLAIRFTDAVIICRNRATDAPVYPNFCTFSLVLA